MKDNLFILIKTLTKSEKRKFKLYASKSDTSLNLYTKLFDSIAKQEIYDDKNILKNNKEIKASQLPNLKQHLYKTILTCLRLIEKEKIISIQIREQLDYVSILYKRGLYDQCLKLLEKIKNICVETHHSNLYFEVLEFKKNIELWHFIKGNSSDKKQLSQQSKLIAEQITRESQLSGICLDMYALYLEFGFAKNNKDKKYIDLFFKLQIKNIDELTLTGKEIVYFYYAHVLYYYLTHNFSRYYFYTLKWEKFTAKYIKIGDKEFEYFLGSVHHVHNSLFCLSYTDKLEQAIKKFEKYISDINYELSLNLQIQIFIQLYISKINVIFLKGNFDEGIKLIPDIEKQLRNFNYQLDTHQILIFYYKIASIYFGNEDYEQSIFYLNKIINLKSGNTRVDLQCFSRMLHLIAHFELKNYDIIGSLAQSLLHFLLKHKSNTKTMVSIINFLKKTNNKKVNELSSYFTILLKQLKRSTRDPYEKRTFLYLDIISYLESKIYNKKIDVIIKEKYLKNIKRF